MIRQVSVTLAAGFATGVVLLAGTARASFSPATSACIKQAVTARKACLLMASSTTCRSEFDTAYANCFAPGDGVACATTCENARTACEDPVQAAERSCVHACGATSASAVKACNGDATCVATAKAASSVCKKSCAQQALPGILQCRTAFGACIAQCPNL
jgi:hypothetical protein